MSKSKVRVYHSSDFSVTMGYADNQEQDEYTAKVYGKPLKDYEIAHQVQCYITQCRCGLLREWYKKGSDRGIDGLKFFETNCECGVCK